MTEKEQVKIELDDTLIEELKTEAKLAHKSFDEFLTYLAKLGLQEYNQKHERKHSEKTRKTGQLMKAW